MTIQDSYSEERVIRVIIRVITRVIYLGVGTSDDVSYSSKSRCDNLDLGGR